MPVVCVFGASDVTLRSGEAPQFETRDMDCRCYPDDSRLMEVVAKDRPAAVVSVGRLEDFPRLCSAPFLVRRMWLHVSDRKELEAKGPDVFSCFLYGALVPREEFPLVSVFTPAYRSGDKIRRPLASLMAQTYKDWEWVVVDDSDDGDKTFGELSELARKDPRIRVYKESRRSGRIGTVKRTACGLARGRFLVELDHDDELTPDALELVVAAFGRHPEVGFVYTDCAECFEDGKPVRYAPGWGLGYGSYRDEVHGGVRYAVINEPNINAKTIRHIVAAPNHIRAWRKDVYEDLGGHRDLLHVADDYELMVRTFLGTRMARIPRMCYVQYRNAEGNTSLGVRNKEIQRLVRCISMYYDEAIHRRFLELGVDDFVWKDGEPSFYRMMSVPNPKVEPHCTVLFEP